MGNSNPSHYSDLAKHYQKAATNRKDKMVSGEWPEAVRAFFRDKEDTIALPPVLVSQEHMAKYDFFDEYEHRERVLGGGTFGNVHACWPLDKEAMSTSNPRSWRKKLKDRYKAAKNAGQLLAVKKMAKSKSKKKRVPLSVPNELGLNYRIEDMTEDEFVEAVQNQYDRWLAELNVLGALQEMSAYTAHLLAVFEDAETLYLVIPMYAGKTLDEAWPKLKKEQKKANGVRLMHQLLWGLKQLADPRVNCIHNDLKPANICATGPLQDADSHLVIIDFGLTRLGPRFDGVAGGTPGWNSPESGLKENTFVTFKSDVYSMGLIFLWMVDQKKRVAKIAGLQDGDLRKLLTKMLEKDESKRWSVDKCLTLRTLFPEISEDDEKTDRPIQHIQHTTIFERGYEEHYDFGNGEWSEEEDACGPEREPAAGGRLAKLQRENRRLREERRKLQHKLRSVEKLVARARHVVR